MSGSPPIGVFGVGDVMMGDGDRGRLVLKILESRYESPVKVIPHEPKRCSLPNSAANIPGRFWS
jgi:hypothetical protein